MLQDRDSDLVVGQEIAAVREIMPGAGVTVLRGHLSETNVRASRDQVRRLLRSQDLYGTAQRHSRPIIRRRYCVAGPRALYHMDGNAKLNLWSMWIEGCIDGFSRRIIFCKVSTNFTAETVKEAFLDGVPKCGIPSRLRTDHGRENMGAALSMI